eukprot:SAG22_NODE_3974_length_1442_cov_2.501862_1_plen_41_part_01
MSDNFTSTFEIAVRFGRAETRPGGGDVGGGPVSPRRRPAVR